MICVLRWDLPSGVRSAGAALWIQEIHHRAETSV